MLGDYEAEPIVKTESLGAITKTVVDNYPLFKRVHADWRHNDFEWDIGRWKALLPEDKPPENDLKRAAKSAESAGMPSLPPLPALVPETSRETEHETVSEAVVVQPNLSLNVPDDEDDDDYFDPLDTDF